MTAGQALDAAIEGYVRKGYLVIARGETSAQLRKPKRFNFVVAVIGFVLGVVPFVVYLLWYLAATDQAVYLSVDERGRVTAK